MLVIGDRWQVDEQTLGAVHTSKLYKLLYTQTESGDIIRSFEIRKRFEFAGSGIHCSEHPKGLAATTVSRLPTCCDVYSGGRNLER